MLSKLVVAALINAHLFFVQLVFAVKDPSTDTLEVTVFDRDMFSPNGKKHPSVHVAWGGGGGQPPEVKMFSAEYIVYVC